ncbi:MAG: hypothetical protein AAGD13_13815 [Pseudomonadota bacterium]
MPYRPSSTITMFFCGSGNNLSEYKATKHAVPYLCKIARFRHIGFAGPGGNSNSTAVYKMNDNGTFFRNDDGNKVYVGPKEIGTSKKSGATGAGVGATIKSALDWLKLHMDGTAGGAPVDTINMCGHSRGSVTAVIVAWAIQAIYKPTRPNLKVNLFLFDPVAGYKNHFQSMYSHSGVTFQVDINQLPNCVDNFEGVMAANMEGSYLVMSKDKGFQSSMPAAPNNGGYYRVFVMPGGHNGATKFNLDKSGSNIGRIGLHLAQTFLEWCGSRFSVNHKLTDAQVLEAYAMARNPNAGMSGVKKKLDEDRHFFSGNNTMLTTDYRAPLVRKHLGHGHAFFVNNHHKELFLRTFGGHDWTMFIASGMISLDEVKRLRTVGNTYNETITAIVELGLIVVPNQPEMQMAA